MKRNPLLIDSYPFLKTAAPTIHTTFGLMALCLVFFLIYRCLSSLEPDRKNLRSYMVFFLIAAGISTLLLYMTNVQLVAFIKQSPPGSIMHWAITQWQQYYLLGLIPLALILFGLSAGFKKDSAFLLDTVALNIPLGMMVLQCAFIITGTGWGKAISLYHLGIPRMLPGPLPVYALCLNLILFYFLRRIHILVHSSSESRMRYRGMVWGVFALLFGSGVQLIDHYGMETRVLFKLTLTQYAMTPIILAGFLCLLWIFFGRDRQKVMEPTKVDDSIRRLIYLAGFVVMTFLMIFIVYYMVKHMRVISWPFRKTNSLADAYSRILQYLPMMGLPAIAFLWMKRSKIALRDGFTWNRLSWWFYPAFAASVYYGLYKLFGESALKGIEYWPPVLILSAMNALSEEYSYRFVFFRLLRQADYSRLASHTAQAALYALPHFMLAGLLFGFMSFLYGLLLGILADKNDSITPAVICHFIIDIGCIGYPLLRI